MHEGRIWRLSFDDAIGQEVREGAHSQAQGNGVGPAQAHALLSEVEADGADQSAGTETENRTDDAARPGPDHSEQLHPEAREDAASAPHASDAVIVGAGRHSHSMVPGGFEVRSRATRLTSRTSLVIRVEIRSRTS